MRAVNLIPSEARGDAGLGGGRSGGGAYAVIGLLAGLTLLALLYGVARHHVSSRESELAAINTREQHARESAGQLTAYTSFIQMHEEREKAVTQLAESRFAWAHSLYELGRVLPLGVSISSLDGSIGSGSTSSSSRSSSSSSSSAKSGGTVASTTPPGSVPTFTITGCATSQNTVATMLNRLSLIHGVKEATLQASSANASGGGASAGSKGCPPTNPTFTVQVVYQPLPNGGASSPASPSSSSVTSDVGGTTLQKAQSTGGGG
jgi:Tfp pilus assembly protein PilN